jgi:sister chromatid cohesion protein DCC1
MKSAPQTTHAQAILCCPNKTYRVQQKNTSNPIMVLEPCYSSARLSDDLAPGMPSPAVHAIATIQDTLELCPQENDDMTLGPTKVNKWHDKFSKGRVAGRSKG